MTDELKRVLILPDLHAPYHDKRAWRLFLQVAKAFEWYAFISLGDFYDAYAVSRYVKDPRKEASLRKEIQLGKRLCLDPLNAIDFERKIITLGNHDVRPATYLQEKAPAVYDEFMEGDWYGFKSTGWEIHNYHDHATLGKLIATHDVAASGALAVLNAVQDNIVTGHDHQLNYVVRGTALGVMHVSATFGWMGDVDHAEYMHSLKARRNWALGFGYGYMEPSGVMHLRPAPIVKYKTVVEGRLFQA